MDVNFSELKYLTLTDIGNYMIEIADNVVDELVRHIPMIIEILPKQLPTKSLRVANALRMTRINVEKLKAAKAKKTASSNNIK